MLKREMVELTELRKIVQDRGRLTQRWTRLPPHLDFYKQALRGKQTRRSLSLIVLPYSQPKSQPDWVKIIAISTYRKPFSVIEELASLLAPAVVEMGIVPVIVPLAERAFAEMSWKTPIVKAMTAYGFLLFDRELLNE